MNKQLEQLKEFHKTMFIKTGDYRADTNQKLLIGNPTAKLRAALIEEEAVELINALLFEDEHQVRKEIADLLYVVFGTAVVYNLPVVQDFNIVHNNNMLKFKTGHLREDGKWVKSKDHPKVDFTKYLTDHQIDLPLPNPKESESVTP